MSDQEDKPGAFIISAIACFVLAALLGIVGWWLLSGYLAGNEDLAKFGARVGRRSRRGGGMSFLGFFGGVATLGSLFMVGVGVAVIYKGMFARKKAEAVDERWRDLPAPSDAPKSGRPIPPRRR